MSTTSTIALARQAIVDKLDAGLMADGFHYAWPGPSADKNEIGWIDRVTPGSWEQEIPNIKAGRKQRQESYVFEAVIWVAQAHGDSTSAKTTFDRAVELCTVAENALADDVQLAETNIQWLVLSSREIDLIPLERGWGCQVVLSIEGNARLT